MEDMQNEDLRCVLNRRLCLEECLRVLLVASLPMITSHLCEGLQQEHASSMDSRSTTLVPLHETRDLARLPVLQV